MVDRLIYGSRRPENLALIQEIKERIGRIEVDALAFDFDGTIADGGQLDPRIRNLFEFLLGCNVPIIICTGRGLGSMQELVLSRFPPEVWDHLYFVLYNGSLGGRFRQEKSEKGIKIVFEVFYSERIPAVREIFSEIQSRLGKYLIFPQNPEDFGSKFRDFSITLVPKEGSFEKLLDEVKRLVAKMNELYKLNLKVFASGRTIDICPIDKNEGLKELLQNVGGIDPDKVIRFGDRGEKGGNDETLLHHPLGFWVKGVDEVLSILSVLEWSTDKFVIGAEQVKQEGNLFQEIFAAHRSLAKRAREGFYEKVNELSGSISFPPTKFSITGSLFFSEEELKGIDPKVRDSLFAAYGRPRRNFYTRGRNFYATMLPAETPYQRLQNLGDAIEKIGEVIIRFSESLSNRIVVYSILDHLRFYSLQLLQLFFRLKVLQALEENNNEIYYYARKIAQECVNAFYQFFYNKNANISYETLLNLFRGIQQLKDTALQIFPPGIDFSDPTLVKNYVSG